MPGADRFLGYDNELVDHGHGATAPAAVDYAGDIDNSSLGFNSNSSKLLAGFARGQLIEYDIVADLTSVPGDGDAARVVDGIGTQDVLDKSELETANSGEILTSHEVLNDIAKMMSVTNDTINKHSDTKECITISTITRSWRQTQFFRGTTTGYKLLGSRSEDTTSILDLDLASVSGDGDATRVVDVTTTEDVVVEAGDTEFGTATGDIVATLNLETQL